MPTRNQETVQCPPRSQEHSFRTGICAYFVFYISGVGLTPDMIGSLNENALREFLNVEIAAALGADGADMDLDALQDYIVVLLKRESTETALEKACEDELVDFLGTNTNKFVRKMFSAIRDGMFDARAPQGSDFTSKRKRDDHANNINKRVKNDNDRSSDLDYGGANMDPSVMAQMMAQMMPGFMPPMSYEDAYSMQHQEPEPRGDEVEEEFSAEAHTHDKGVDLSPAKETDEPSVQEAEAGEEKCTLRCVGVPPHTKEDSLFRHFRQYGTVVKLEYIEESGEPAGSEYCVQFLCAEAALKCLTSPSAVLNNRHVALVLADVNLVPVAEAQEYVDQAQTRGYMDDGSGGYDGYSGRGGRGRGRGRGRFAARGGFRGGRGGRIPYGGRSSYLAYPATGRGRGGPISTATSYAKGGGAATESSRGGSVVTASPVVAEVALPSSTSPTVTKGSSSEDEGGESGRTGGEDEDLYGDIEDARAREQESPAAEGLHDVQKAKFEELKRLREEAELMWEKKESVITSQQATVGAMIKATANPKQLVLLESKMKDLHAKLAEIKADRAKSAAATTSAGSAGRGGRGFGRGGRGGRFGRGRGGRHSFVAARGSGGSTYIRR